MNLNDFIAKILESAKREGIDPAEVYAVRGDSFECEALKGEISKYAVNTSFGLSLRGIYEGRMGYAATEAMDDAAIDQMIKGVKESALYLEAEEKETIFEGAAFYPQVDTYAPELDKVTGEEKLDAALRIEKATMGADARIRSILGCEVQTASEEICLVNSFGLNLKHRDNVAIMASFAVAQDGESKAVDGKIEWGRDFGLLNPEQVGEKAAKAAVEGLNAKPVKSGIYRVILTADAMASLLATFSGVFSAEEAQQGLSLLKGREGEMIAAPCVCLADDPLMPNGLATRAFDAEGVPGYRKLVIEEGKLNTLLHNCKTAALQGVKSTGNASKAGYAAPVKVAPANFYFVPGSKDLAGLMSDMGDGLVINDLSGLHSGADPISGDFSLLSRGYVVQNGEKGQAVEQITIAGNFFELLKNIRQIGSDLVFPGRRIGSSSVDIGEIYVAGL